MPVHMPQLQGTAPLALSILIATHKKLQTRCSGSTSHGRMSATRPCWSTCHNMSALLAGSNKDADNSANNNKSDPEGAAFSKAATGPATGQSWEIAQGPQVGMDDATGSRARRTSFSIPAEK